MGITKNEYLKGKFEYLSILSWYLDCWTALIRNILIYTHLVPLSSLRMKKRRNSSHCPSALTWHESSSISRWPMDSSTLAQCPARSWVPAGRSVPYWGCTRFGSD